MSSAKIGKFIQECRKEKKLTQEELGELLGVSSKSISRWENGITMPDLSLVTTIADILNVEVSELLNGQRMDKEELLRIRAVVDKIIKYSNYEIVTKNKKYTFFLFMQSCILLIVIISNFFHIFSILFNSKAEIIINISLHVFSLILGFARLFCEKKEYEFKVNNMILSDTNIDK